VRVSFKVAVVSAIDDRVPLSSEKGSDGQLSLAVAPVSYAERARNVIIRSSRLSRQVCVFGHSGIAVRGYCQLAGVC